MAFSRCHISHIKLFEWNLNTNDNLTCESYSVCLTLCDPTDYTVHRILQAKILEWVVFPFSKGSSQPRDQIQVSYIADEFLTSWVTREALYTGVGILPLLQQIFPTQELNRGLLNCRQILYQLSCQGRSHLETNRNPRTEHHSLPAAQDQKPAVVLLSAREDDPSFSKRLTQSVMLHAKTGNTELSSS